MMNEITLFYKLQGKTLVDALDVIYEKYGYAQESLIANSYPGLSGKQKIDNIMSYFRGRFKDNIASEQVKIFFFFCTLTAIDIESQDTEQIEMTKSNVLGFEFKSGHQLFLRPSGTEPKIKFYTMVKVYEGDLETKKSKAANKINEIESFIHQAIEGL